jgi:opacity protein-like surface antigen
MHRFRVPFIAAAAVFGFAAQAQAADLRYPPLEPAPVIVRESMSGWYLRGDLGYRLNNIGDVFVGGIVPNVPVTGGKMDNSYMVGGGAGYKWSWFRADVTLDYGTQTKYTGSALTPSDTTIKIDSFTTLFNAYADLGTWYGFTPYIGAGAGAAYLRASGLSAPGAVIGPVISDGTKWNFAWAAMAGLSYSITPTWLVDVGYRYLHLGDVHSGADAANAALNLKNLNAHEFRLGARWAL